jgi:hypothetical protein
VRAFKWATRQDGYMAEPSERLVRRVRQDFSTTDAIKVIDSLLSIPETLPLGGKQDPERLQAALVLIGAGNYQTFEPALRLAHVDWRDLLVDAGLEHSDWPSILDAALGRP